MEITLPTTKFTPGPWGWQRHGKKYPWELMALHSGMLLVMDSTRLGMSLAQPRFAIRSDSMGGLMHKAEELDVPNHPDAALIAAAPDLFAALRELALLAGPLHDTDCSGDENCDCSFKATNDMVRAALAKATGGAK